MREYCPKKYAIKIGINEKAVRSKLKNYLGPTNLLPSIKYLPLYLLIPADIKDSYCLFKDVFLACLGTSNENASISIGSFEFKTNLIGSVGSSKLYSAKN